MVYAFATGLAASVMIATTPAPDVGLVLFITVDQLRGDMPARMHDRFGPDGLRRLMDEGVQYTNAHYRHSTTFTAVGHATLVTGASPEDHGIVGNVWGDHASGRKVYSVEDARHVIIGEAHVAGRGTSPANLLAGTVGDEVVVATNGVSRVFSVSVKDRGAILPGGRLGKAYWYEKTTGRFITSTYYADAYPAWVTAWNAARHAAHYQGAQWSLLADPSTYEQRGHDDRSFERTIGSLDRTFPHQMSLTGDAEFYSTLRYTPFADVLTVDFAKTLLAQEKLGRGDATDLLFVSLSATDYIGHNWGPGSLEAEDNLLRLDRTIADLVTAAERQAGPGRVLVVLSSDHGIDSAPEHRHTLTCDDDDDAGWRPRSPGQELRVRGSSRGEELCCPVGRLLPDDIMARVNDTLSQKLGCAGQFVNAFYTPGLYIDEAFVHACGLELAEVEAAAAAVVAEFPGVALAVTRTDLMTGRVPDQPLYRMLTRSFHPARSGHITIIQDPFWFLHHVPMEDAAMHGSPYAYDTHVPVIFWGPGITSEVVHRRVGPEDIAPTLSALLGVEAPSSARGEVLREVMVGARP